MIAPLEFKLLGHVQITVGGQPLSGFVSNKAQALLCYLAFSGQAHTRDDLAALLWSDMPEAEAKANLRVTLHNLRQMLPEHLHTDRRLVGLHAHAPYHSDVACFRSHLQAYDAAPEQAIEPLYKAIALYEGELLHGIQPRGAILFDEWLLIQREQLRQQLMQSQHAIAAYHLERAEYHEALQATLALIKLEPWHEGAHRQAMMLFALNGQRHLALAQYQTCCAILRDEFSAEPEAATRRLDQRIRADQVNEVSLPQRTSTSSSEPSLPAMPLVGRSTAFSWLLAQRESVGAGTSHLSMIQGSVGSGKTHLAQAILRFAALNGDLIVPLSCREFCRAIAYQPIIDLLRAVLRQSPELATSLPKYWLRELALLLPELHEPSSPISPVPGLDGLLSRQRLFEAVAALLQAFVTQHGGRVVIFLDDLHHADIETIDLLHYLISQPQSPAIWYLGADQPASRPNDHALTLLYHSLRGAGRAAQRSLDPLDLAAVNQLVKAFEGLESDVAALLANELTTVSGGNPRLIAGLLEEHVRRGVLCRVRGSWWLDQRRFGLEATSLSPELQALVREHIGPLSDDMRVALLLAASLGQNFELGFLARALGIGLCEASARIKPCLARQIVCEITLEVPQPNAGSEPLPELHYAFVSPLVRQALEADVTASERHWLSERVGVARRLANLRQGGGRAQLANQSHMRRSASGSPPNLR